VNGDKVMTTRIGAPLLAIVVLSLVCLPTGARAQCCLSSSGCFCDVGGTIKDTCTGYTWEKKTTAVGSGVNPANLNDVDNKYSWAGCCGGDCSSLDKLCQPNVAAAATCAAHSSGGQEGCSTCPNGVCVVNPLVTGALTTVWDWINQVNASNFAGHNDWRVPTSYELGSIDTTPISCGLMMCTHECPSYPCINSIFGFTQSAGYWTNETGGSIGGTAVAHPFGGINPFAWFDMLYPVKQTGQYVRAVR